MFGKDLWFIFHLPIMVLVALISIAAFLVILAEDGWSWAGLDDPVCFAHSIFGIVTIGIAHFQVNKNLI